MVFRKLRGLTPGSTWLGLVGPSRSIQRCRGFIIVASALVCVYAASVFAYVLTLPDIGLRCAFSPVVNRADTAYAPKGTTWPDLRDCTVIQLGDQRIDNWPQFLRVLTELGKQPVQADLTALSDARAPRWTHVRVEDEELVRAKLRTADNDETISIWCRLGRTSMESLIPSVLWFFLKAGLFTVAAVVFWKRPEDVSIRQFFLLSLATFGAYMGGYHWSRIVTQPALLLTFIFCSVFVPAVSLHFYLVFPRPKQFFQKQPRWSLLAIYAPAAVFLLLLVTDYLSVRVIFHGTSDIENVAGSLELLLRRILFETHLYFGVAALWYLASFVALVHSFRTARDVTERNQVKWILYGVLASLLPIGYTLYLAFVQPSDFGGGAGTWPMFAASVCVTTAYTVSITRYRLMQLDQIISSGVVYFLFSFLAGSVYYAIVFVATLLFSQWNPTSLTQAVTVSAAVLMLMLVLDWIRSRVKRALDRRFYRDKHRLDRTLRRLSQAIEQLIDAPVLARQLLQASADLLGVPRGAVYLREGEPARYRLADALGPTPPLSELPADSPLLQALRARGTLVARHQSESEFDPARHQLQLVGGEVAQALVHEGQLLAILVLGPKDLGFYNADDLNLLAAFAQLTALALESAQGHRMIETLNRDLQAKVEKISEQQRRILALQSQLMHQRETVVRSPVPASTSLATKEKSEDNSQTIQSILGSSLPVRQLVREVKKVSASSSVVLIRGESGTGKGLLAQALHESSPRARKPFVKLHCAALSAGLLESELFGHVKGAFTGAHRDKVGRFELANGGTLFLDEIGDISLDVQTKLLRVLQEKTFERVGSSEPMQTDVRVITATHQNLELLIKEGRFREDLYYRLNVISITVPALRERREDIPELAQHFLSFFAERSGKGVSQIDDDAFAILKAYDWPGNVRQLENVIERAVVVAEGDTITSEELPPEIREAVGDLDLSRIDWFRDEPSLLGPRGLRAERAERDRRERERLVHALAVAKGNKAEAARALGLARSTLVSRLRKHGLQ